VGWGLGVLGTDRFSDGYTAMADWSIGHRFRFTPIDGDPATTIEKDRHA
jgi:hypothetical protein